MLRTKLLWLSVVLVLDVLFYLRLRGGELVDQEVLRSYAIVVIGMHGLDGLVTGLFVLAPRTRSTAALLATILLEMVSTSYWIHITGTSTSYFALGPALLAMCYRVYVGYLAGMVAAASAFLIHSATFAAELTGTVAPHPLFLGDPGFGYQVAAYRELSISAILCSYFLFFAIANGMVRELRNKELQLIAARREVDRAFADGARGGRLSGTVVGDDYYLAESLGIGGMGEVYRARRVSDGLVCAVKVLHPHVSHDSVQLARFSREADAANRIEGLVAPRVLARRLESPGESFIAMEYLQGEDLSAFLRRRGALPPREALQYLQLIAKAVEAAHAAGIIHRDLTPRNIFLLRDARDGEPKIRLLDFGIAKLGDVQEPLTQTCAVLGTPGFMSPEQALGQTGDVGPEADIYSLGVIAYLAVTGRRPFAATEAPQALYEAIHAPAPRPSQCTPGLHPRLDDVILRAMHKDPAERYHSTRAFADELTSAVGESATSRATPVTSSAADAPAEQCGQALDRTITENVSPVTPPAGTVARTTEPNDVT